MEQLKHSAGDSFRQTIESEKLHLESQKKSISQKVINKLYDLLLKFGSVISTSCDEKLEAKENPESGEITFDGQIEVSVVIKDVSGNRSAVIPVAVIDSNPNIEPDAVNKLIENAPINESKVDAVSSTPKISVDLSKFKLTDDGSEFIKVSHKAIGKDIGVIEKSALLPTQKQFGETKETSYLVTDSRGVQKNFKTQQEAKTYYDLLGKPTILASQKKKADLDMTKTPLEQVTEAYKESLAACLTGIKENLSVEYPKQSVLLDSLITENTFENVKDIVIINTEPDPELNGNTYYIKVNYKDGGDIETSVLIQSDGDYEFESSGIGFKFWNEIAQPIEYKLSQTEEGLETVPVNLESMLKQVVLDETSDWNADVEFTGTFVKPEIPKKAQLEKEARGVIDYLQEALASLTKETPDIEYAIRQIETARSIIDWKELDDYLQEALFSLKTPDIVAAVNEIKRAIAIILHETSKSSSIVKEASLEIVAEGNVGGGCTNPSEPLEVVDNDLTTKFKSADSYNQNIERDTFILSQKKQRLQDEAANHIYKSLISLGYNPVKIVSSEAIENKVVVKVEFFDGVTKLASFDYLAEKVADEETIKLFNETAKNATIKENIEEQLAAETSEKLKEIDKYSEWHTKTTEAALEKEAGSLGVSNTPQLYQYQPLVRINKAFLPDVLKEGDIIPLNGRKYKIVSLSDGQLSKELNSGSLATLEMIS